MNTKVKKVQRDRRRKRIRAKISGTTDNPRLSVFKSNKYVTAQLIDDERGVTLISASTKGVKGKNMREKSEAVGKTLAALALKKGIDRAIFDRGGYLYTGSIMALATGAREGGLKF